MIRRSTRRGKTRRRGIMRMKKRRRTRRKRSRSRSRKRSRSRNRMGTGRRRRSTRSWGKRQMRIRMGRKIMMRRLMMGGESASMASRGCFRASGPLEMDPGRESCSGPYVRMLRARASELNLVLSSSWSSAPRVSIASGPNSSLRSKSVRTGFRRQGRLDPHCNK